MTNNKIIDQYIEYQLCRTKSNIIKPIRDLGKKLIARKKNERKRKSSGLNRRTESDI